MLGVRTSKPNLASLSEAGLPPVQALLRKKNEKIGLQRFSIGLICMIIGWVK